MYVLVKLSQIISKRFNLFLFIYLELEDAQFRLACKTN